jgi:adenylate cyclase
MPDRSDILGGAVNAATRLERLAEPGGVCVSTAMREYTQHRLNIKFEDASVGNDGEIAKTARRK